MGPLLGPLSRAATAGAGGRKERAASRWRSRSANRVDRLRPSLAAGRRPGRLKHEPHNPGSQDWQHRRASRHGQVLPRPHDAVRAQSQHTVRACFDRAEYRVGDSAVSASSWSSLSSDRDLLRAVVAGEATPARRWSILSCHCTTNERRAADSSPWERSGASFWGVVASDAREAWAETAKVAVPPSGRRSGMDSSIGIPDSEAACASKGSETAMVAAAIPNR